MPFSSGAISLGDIRNLWDSSGSGSISLNDFYRTSNSKNYHSEGLPISSGDSDIDLTLFRNVGAPLKKVSEVKSYSPGGSLVSSSTDIVPVNSRYNPGVDHSVANAWKAAGAPEVPRTVAPLTANDPNFSSYGSFYANNGTYYYYKDRYNTDTSGFEWARVTLSSAYDLSAPTAGSYVDYNFSSSDLRDLVTASMPGTRHASSTYFTSGPSATFPYAVYMKNDGTKIWCVALDMRHMDESFSSTDGDTLVEFTLTTAYDISTATWSTYHVFSDDNVKNSKVMGFSLDGTVLLIQGQDYSPLNKRLSKYTLSSAWDISTISYSGSTSLSTISGEGDDDISWIDFWQGYSNSLPTKAIINSRSYNIDVSGSSPTFTLSGTADYVVGIPFSSGTKLLRQGKKSSLIKEHTFSTAYDHDTLSTYDPTAYSSTTPTNVTLVNNDLIIETSDYTDKTPICWSSDGTKVFYLARINGGYSYLYMENCTTPWTLEGVTFNSSSVASKSNYPISSAGPTLGGLDVSSDGTKIFVYSGGLKIGGSFFNRTYSGYSTIVHFAMTTAYNLTTIPAADPDGLDRIFLEKDKPTIELSQESGYSSSISTAWSYALNTNYRFSPDGRKLIVQHTHQSGFKQDGMVTAIEMSTPYDITTSPAFEAVLADELVVGTTSINGDYLFELTYPYYDGTSIGTFWGDGDGQYHDNILDIGLDGYTAIFHSGSSVIVGNKNSVIFRSLNQKDPSYITSSLFSTDRAGEGFSSTDSAREWSAGLSPAGPHTSLKVDKEYILGFNDSDGGYRYPKKHDFKYLPNGKIMTFNKLLDSEVPDYFRLIELE